MSNRSLNQDMDASVEPSPRLGFVDDRESHMNGWKIREYHGFGNSNGIVKLTIVVILCVPSFPLCLFLKSIYPFIGEGDEEAGCFIAVKKGTTFFKMKHVSRPKCAIFGNDSHRVN